MHARNANLSPNMTIANLYLPPSVYLDSRYISLFLFCSLRPPPPTSQTLSSDNRGHRSLRTDAYSQHSKLPIQRWYPAWQSAASVLGS